MNTKYCNNTVFTDVLYASESMVKKTRIISKSVLGFKRITIFDFNGQSQSCGFDTVVYNLSDREVKLQCQFVIGNTSSCECIYIV